MQSLFVLSISKCVTQCLSNAEVGLSAFIHVLSHYVKILTLNYQCNIFRLHNPNKVTSDILCP